MSYTDNITQTELELRTSGFFSPDIDTYEDVALNTFDVTAMDYDAPGLEGWGNRLKGLANFANPLAWAGTFAAQIERQQIENEDLNQSFSIGDVFAAAGKTIWEVGVEGFLMGGVGSVERAITSLGISAFALTDAIADWRETGEFTPVFKDFGDFVDSWDLSKTKNLDLGELVVLNSLTWATAVLGIERKLMAEGFGYLPYTDPLEWLKSDFDPLNQEDILLFDKENQLNAVTGVANFVGWVITDPFTFLSGGTSALLKVPLTASYKYSYGFSKGAKTKLFAKDELELEKIMNGQVDGVNSQIKQYVDAMVKNNALQNEMLLRGLGGTGKNARSLAFLLGRAQNEQQVATLLLSVQYGNDAARSKLKTLFMKDPDSMLALDDIGTGGTGAKQYVRNPDLLDEGPMVSTRLPENVEYNQISKQYAESVEAQMDEFFASYDTLATREAYESLIYQQIEGGAKSVEIAAPTPIMNRSFQSTGLFAQTIPGLKNFYSRRKIGFARFRADVITGDPGRIGVVFEDMWLGRTLVKWYRSATTTSLRGAIDFNDTGNTLADKYYSLLIEADKATNGSFRNIKNEQGISKFDEMLEKFQASTTTQELKEVFDEIQIETIRTLVAKNPGTRKLLDNAEEWKAFIEKFYNNGLRRQQDELTYKQLSEGNWTERALGRVHEKESIKTVAENANWYQTLDLVELSKYFERYVEIGKGPQMGREALDLGGELLRQFNAYWSAGVLLRPARFFRERLANGLGIMLSGLAVELWLNGQNFKSVGNLFSNIYNSGANWAKGRKIAREMYDVDPNGDIRTKKGLNNAVETLGETFNNVNKTVQKYENVINDLEEISITNEHMTEQLRIDAEYEAQLKGTETRYYGSSDEFDVENISEDRMVPLSRTKEQAEDYANDFGEPIVQPIIKEDYESTLAEYKKRMGQLDNEIAELEEWKKTAPISKVADIDDHIENTKNKIKRIEKTIREVQRETVIDTKTGKTVILNGKKAQSFLGSEEYANNILKQIKRNQSIWKRDAKGNWEEISREDFGKLNKETLDSLEIKVIDNAELNTKLNEGFNTSDVSASLPKPQIIAPYGSNITRNMLSSEGVAVVGKDGNIRFMSKAEIETKSPKFFEENTPFKYSAETINTFVERNGTIVQLADDSFKPFVAGGKTPGVKKTVKRYAEQVIEQTKSTDVILIKAKTGESFLDKPRYQVISREKLSRMSDEMLNNSDIRIVNKNTFENGVKEKVLKNIELPEPQVKLTYGEQVLKTISEDTKLWVKDKRAKTYKVISREEFAKLNQDEIKKLDIKATSITQEQKIIESTRNFEPEVPLTKKQFDDLMEELNAELDNLKNMANSSIRAKQILESSGGRFRTIDNSIESVKRTKEQLDNDFASFATSNIPVDKRTGKYVIYNPETSNVPYGQILVDRVPEGKQIYVRAKGSKSYSIVSREDFATWSKQKVDRHDVVTSPKAKNPTVTPVVYGGEKFMLKNFDELPETARQILKVNNQDELNRVISSESFRDNKEFIKWAEDNNYGKIIVKQGKRETVFTTKKFVSTPKKDASYELAKERVQKNIDRLYKEHSEKLEMDISYRNRQELLAKDEEFRLYVEHVDNIRTQINNNDERIQLIADLKAKLDHARALRDKIGTRYQNGVDFLNNKKKNKKTRFKGQQEFVSANGEVYYLNNILEGTEGEITEKMIYATSVQGDLINTIDPSIHRNYDGISKYEVDYINPEDENYALWYAGYLKGFARNDGAFQRVAEKLNEIRQRPNVQMNDEVFKEIETDLLDWLRNTPEGRRYAIDNRIGRKYTRGTEPADKPGVYKTQESFAASMTRYVDEELYDDDVLKLFAGRDEFGNRLEINKEAIQRALQGKELRKVQGQIPTFSRDVSGKGVQRTINRALNWTNGWLVETPQTYLENVPMAQQFYMNNFKRMIDANETKLGRKLTIDEISAINIQSRTLAVNETRKWLYNIQGKWNITEKLGAIIPFLTAVTFTNKMIYRAAKENPEAFLWTLGMGTKIMGQNIYADQDGNPISLREAITPGNTSYLMLNIPEPLREVLGKTPIFGPILEETKNLRVSMRSLNVWFGQEWVPQMGPLVAVPVNVVVNLFPMLSYNTNYVFEALTGVDLIDYFLPFGRQDDLLNMILPTWVNQVGDLAEAGEQYQDAFAKVLAYETAKYRLDPTKYGEPDIDEINKQVRALFAFKLLSSTSFVASTSIQTEVDHYRQIHRKLIDEFGSEQADWIMLTKYPEFIGVTVSTTENPYSLNANAETFDNLNSMPNVVNIFQYGGEGAKDMLGWAVNPSGVGRYEDFFYDYLRSASAGPGAEPYRRILTPQEIEVKAAAKAGWAIYNKFHDTLDAYATENNINWKDDKRASAYRAQLIKELSVQYPEWASEYKSSNFNRFNERADALELLLNEPEWVRGTQDQTDLTVFRSFIEMRKYIKNDLFVKGLTLASSKAHRKIYEDFILELKKESVEFSTFYNKFFEGDSLN